LAGAVVGAIVSLYFGAEAFWMIGGGGAWLGALAGALTHMRGGRQEGATREHPVEPAGGGQIPPWGDPPRTPAPPGAARRRFGARDLGRTEGVWRDGGWRDFDPRAPLATV